ncbi:MAG: urea ABC transporter substrate-binding protein [Verrucomicrobia bacterium CG_4_10_14_3_um_filter_43_23]|nr:MAG: hypothetical protein AUJ82_02490 [Verrucomicrobia bacterium CG1_02_43_26]PIX57600.1 MAG: urea ABC transporter substrate-binding protein [Verrucomicrobia bacterium CG_4_10_14_3_um_filter_43_23]
MRTSCRYKFNCPFVPCFLFIAVAFGVLLFSGCEGPQATDNRPVRVGVLYSMSGRMESEEKPVVDAILFAIDEINQSGGLLGRRIEPVVVDGASRRSVFKEQAINLIEKDKVAVIFGGWMLLSRDIVRPVFEDRESLLFYPYQSKGMASSTHVVNTGALLNQQVVPGISWAYRNLGQRFFLVGSKEVFPYAANTVIKDHIYALGGSIVGEEYISIESEDIDSIVSIIKNVKPEVIVCTTLGKTTIALYQSLRKAGISPDDIPSIGFTIDEVLLQQLMQANIDMAGDYGVWNYFQSIQSQQNHAFLNEFKKKYGQNRAVSDTMVSAYIGVKLWAEAVKSGKSFREADVLDHVGGKSMESPGGLVYVDPQTNHLYKTVYIGEALSNGQYKLVWESDYPVSPVVYPMFRSQQEWEELSNIIHDKWGLN